MTNILGKQEELAEIVTEKVPPLSWLCSSLESTSAAFDREYLRANSLIESQRRER